MITKPSDDPGGTAKAMALRAEKRAGEQFARNADDGLAWLSTIGTALSSSVSALRNARELTVRGASPGALNPAACNAIAADIDGVRSSLLAEANATYLGRSVFAGTSDKGVAFVVTPAAPPVTTTHTYMWTGTADAPVERRLAQDTSVRVDSVGVEVFGAGDQSVFTLLDTIAAGLRAGTDVGGYLTDLDAHLDTMLGGLSSVGTRHDQVTSARSSLSSGVLELKSQLAAIEDIDLPQVIVELRMQEVAYQGALGATARVLQPTLVDFLR